MARRGTLHAVTEQELHLKVGAYDELHHAHGYRWARERHHWYWFAGIAATLVGLVGIAALYWQYDRGQAPICDSTFTQSATSADGSTVASLARVSCLGGAPSLRIILTRTGDSPNASVIAAFSEQAAIQLRWSTDGELIVAKGGGRVWYSKPKWKSVHVQYVSM